jgi:hypothetical protein
MAQQRAIELLTGWISCILGGLAIAFALYAPLFCPVSSSRPFPVPFSPGCTSEVSDGSPNFALIFALFGLAFAAITIGVTLDALFKMRIGFFLLVGGIAILLAGMFLALASFGWLLLPSLALAGIALWKAAETNYPSAVRS